MRLSPPNNEFNAIYFECVKTTPKPSGAGARWMSHRSDFIDR